MTPSPAVSGPLALDALFEPIMQRAVAEIGVTSTTLEHIAAYHLGWRNADLTPVKGERPNAGKRIRPRLAMLVTAALDADPALAAPVAAAIELLHNFTLVHDDIQDRSHLRRHRATVWSLWGEAQAINAGDALFAASHLALYDVANHSETAALLAPLSAAFDRTTLAIVGGQTMDIENEGNTGVQLDRYLRTIAGKTSAIVEFSAWAGGVVARASDEQAADLAAFGLATGMAFQIRDDVLGIWGATEATGKTPADDIRRQKQTPPMIELRNAVNDEERMRLDSWFSQAPVSDDAVAAILRLLDRYDMRAHTEGMVRAYHDDATAALGRVVSREDNEPSRQLYALLDGLEHRSG
ncbi:MAG: polyprenyl synthetase family protein [Thermomicrobiales bacterium]|nr:MAG: polyprenyl synthetase family protein [Thermomicrobiales bacterium]